MNRLSKQQRSRKSSAGNSTALSYAHKKARAIANKGRVKGKEWLCELTIYRK
ncbi:MAG: hypothetical protein PHO76_08425 [Methylotenera sp.]|nr:hypothetical protein [Methylotenera sp.]MDD4926453.1 hypothetical protein [Methylotenera sp.]